MILTKEHRAQSRLDLHRWLGAMALWQTTLALCAVSRGLIFLRTSPSFPSQAGFCELELGSL
jgi:hypothetical protein